MPSGRFARLGHEWLYRRGGGYVFGAGLSWMFSDFGGESSSDAAKLNSQLTTISSQLTTLQDSILKFQNQITCTDTTQNYTTLVGTYHNDLVSINTLSGQLATLAATPQSVTESIQNEPGIQPAELERHPVLGQQQPVFCGEMAGV